MTKQEFLRQFSEKLSEEMDPTEVMKEVRYYEGYIDGEMARGKSEEEATRDLGSPVLIARNILESPHEEDEEISLFQEEESQEAYEEGTFQGENQLSEDEIKSSICPEKPELNWEEDAQEQPFKKKDSSDEISVKSEDETEDVHKFAEDDKREHETGWNLFSLILALLLGVTAIIFLVRNAISSPNHLRWIVMLIALAVILVLLIRNLSGSSGPHDKGTR